MYSAVNPSESPSTGNALSATSDNIYSTLGLIPPERIGFFSCKVASDGESELYCPDKSSLTFLRPNYQEVVGKGLAQNFTDESKWGPIAPGQIQILQWMSENKKQLDDGDEIDFICHSSRLLREMILMRRDKTRKLTFTAIKVGRSIILNEVETEEKRKTIADRSLNCRGTYAGKKLVELITCCADGSPPIIHRNGTHDAFYFVNRWTFRGYTLLYSNRVDCAIDKEQLDRPLKEMECALIRTRPCSYNPTQIWTLNRQINWWTASLFSGIDLIILCDKSRFQTVFGFSSISSINLLESENMREWPGNCVNHLDNVLRDIKESVDKEDTVYCYNLQCDPMGKLILDLI